MRTFFGEIAAGPRGPALQIACYAVCGSFGPHEGVTFDQAFWDEVRLNILLLVASHKPPRKSRRKERSK